MFANLKACMIWVAENKYGGMPENCEQLYEAVKIFSVVGVPGLEAKGAMKNCIIFCNVMDKVQAFEDANPEKVKEMLVSNFAELSDE